MSAYPLLTSPADRNGRLLTRAERTALRAALTAITRDMPRGAIYAVSAYQDRDDLAYLYQMQRDGALVQVAATGMVEEV